MKERNTGENCNELLWEEKKSNFTYEAVLEIIIW